MKLPQQMITVANILRCKIGVDRDEALSLAGFGYARAMHELETNDRQFVKCAFRRAIDLYRTETGSRRPGWKRLLFEDADQIDPRQSNAVEVRDTFAWAVRRTRGVDRVILVSAYQEGISMTELARRIGWSDNTVMWRQRNMIQRLRVHAECLND